MREQGSKGLLCALQAAVGFGTGAARASGVSEPWGQDLCVGGWQPTSANPLWDLHEQLWNAAAQMDWTCRISSLGFTVFLSEEEIA